MSRDMNFSSNLVAKVQWLSYHGCQQAIKFRTNNSPNALSTPGCHHEDSIHICVMHVTMSFGKKRDGSFDREDSSHMQLQPAQYSAQVSSWALASLLGDFKPCTNVKPA
eukprot:scaffold215302_cov19-Prasinocladus_malaysianus.AAC.2